MIREDKPLAQAVAGELVAELKAGRREAIDVDDIIAALEGRAAAPPRGTQAFEELLELTLLCLVAAG